MAEKLYSCEKENLLENLDPERLTAIKSTKRWPKASSMLLHMILILIYTAVSMIIIRAQRFEPATSLHRKFH